MATKVTTVIVYFFVGLNAGAVLLHQAGIDALLGINVATGGAAKTQQIATTYQSIPTGKNVGATMIGMYTAVTGFVADVATYIFPGMQMLANVGVSDFWIAFGTTIAGAALVFDLAAFIKGVDL